MTDTAPLTDQQLRDRIAAAVRSAPTGRFNVSSITDAVLAVVQPELDRLHAELARIQRWATETVHGSAAAEVLLLIRDLPETAADPTT